MLHRTVIVTSFIVATFAIFAADPSPSLLQAKTRLRQQLIVNLPTMVDGAVFKHDHELEDILNCMQPFETLIYSAKSVEECELIEQKLNLARMLVRNRTIFEGSTHGRAVYTHIIPKIVALPELWSPYDTTLDVKSWQPK